MPGLRKLVKEHNVLGETALPGQGHAYRKKGDGREG